MATPSFEDLTAAVDRRIREIAGAGAGAIRRDDGTANAVRWERNGAWATLTFHDGARVELSLHPSGEVPDILEILLSDADVVDMIAVPAADHLAKSL